MGARAPPCRQIAASITFIAAAKGRLDRAGGKRSWVFLRLITSIADAARGQAAALSGTNLSINAQV